MGTLDGCPILASETCALDIIGAKYVCDVENGEVLIFDDEGHGIAKLANQVTANGRILEFLAAHLL